MFQYTAFFRPERVKYKGRTSFSLRTSLFETVVVRGPHQNVGRDRTAVSDTVPHAVRWGSAITERWSSKRTPGRCYSLAAAAATGGPKPIFFLWTRTAGGGGLVVSKRQPRDSRSRIVDTSRASTSADW